jgi:hypothetical protein
MKAQKGGKGIALTHNEITCKLQKFQNFLKKYLFYSIMSIYYMKICLQHEIQITKNINERSAMYLTLV